VDETAYKKSLADQLKSLACSGDKNTAYIVRGLIANARIKDTDAKAPDLVKAILKPDCPVSAALTEADKAALKRIANEASGAQTMHLSRPSSAPLRRRVEGFEPPGLRGWFRRSKPSPQRPKYRELPTRDWDAPA
jgi:hypothetical protein